MGGKVKREEAKKKGGKIGMEKLFALSFSDIKNCK